MAWTVEDMVELGTRHAELEARRDLEGTLATLAPDPVYELLPVGRRMAGVEQVRRRSTRARSTSAASSSTTASWESCSPRARCSEASASTAASASSDSWPATRSSTSSPACRKAGPGLDVEIPFVVGNYTMLSMVAKATGVPVGEGLPPLPRAGTGPSRSR